MSEDTSRLVVVSNRLPVVLTRNDEDTWTARQGSGGLISALAPILRDRGGVWIGWPGTSELDAIEDTLRDLNDEAGYELVPVQMSAELVKGYYEGFSNEIVWPLFHDMPSRCNFQPDYWESYLEANMLVAQRIAEVSRPNDLIWVQDYHLLMCGDALRQLGKGQSSSFFLHIPFPSLDLFMMLPWRFEILRGLLEYNTIGFQSQRDVRNFIACIRAVVRGVRIRGRGQSFEVELPDHTVRVGSFPIGIDATAFRAHAESESTEREMMRLRDQLPNTRIVLGVDRLDYSKGLPHRIKALRELLRSHPHLQGQITLLQVVIPSREGVPEYQALRQEVEQLVGQVNGEFTQPGWVPVHYLYRSLSQDELIGWYRASDICLVTPLKDGMNLVAKEYCACNIDDDGVLILSEFAGAAAQLQRGALLVNPYDVVGTADALYRAITMSPREQRQRMRRLRANVERENVAWWADAFLDAAFHRRLEDFAVHEYFVPHTDVRVPFLSAAAGERGDHP